MGYAASQLKMPISFQCRSSLFLNVLIDVASTTCCGSLFHSLTIRKLKKFCPIVVRHLGLNNFNECHLSPLVTSASSKNLLQLTCSFPVSILNVSIKSPRNLHLSREQISNFLNLISYGSFLSPLAILVALLYTFYNNILSFCSFGDHAWIQ